MLLRDAYLCGKNIKNQATSPLAGIQNKENFPFHQPGLFTDFWA